MKSLSRTYVFAVLITYFAGNLVGHIALFQEVQFDRLAAGVLAIVFLPLFIKVLPAFRRKTSTGVLLVVLFLSIGGFLLQFFLALSGLRPLPENITLQRLFVGSYFYIMATSILVMVYTLWDESDYLSFFKVLYRLLILIGIESIVFFYVLGGQVMPELFISYGVRFNSAIIGSDSIVGRLGLALFALSMFFYHKENSSRHLWGVALSLLLTYSSFSRPSLVAWFVLAALLVVANKYLGRGKRLGEILFGRGAIKIIISSVIGIVVLFAIAGKTRKDFGREDTLYARFLIWGQAIEVAEYGFPLGVGGNQSNYYMVSEIFQSSSLLEGIADRLDWFDLTQRYVEGLTRDYQTKEYLSPHSLPLDLIIDFGLVGMGVVWWMYRIPLSAYLRNIRLAKNQVRFLVLTFAGFLISFHLSVLFDSGSDRIVWIIGIFYCYLLRPDVSPRILSSTEEP